MRSQTTLKYLVVCLTCIIQKIKPSGLRILTVSIVPVPLVGIMANHLVPLSAVGLVRSPIALLLTAPPIALLLVRPPIILRLFLVRPPIILRLLLVRPPIILRLLLVRPPIDLLLVAPPVMTLPITLRLLLVIALKLAWTPTTVMTVTMTATDSEMIGRIEPVRRGTQNLTAMRNQISLVSIRARGLTS